MTKKGEPTKKIVSRERPSVELQAARVITYSTVRFCAKTTMR